MNTNEINTPAYLVQIDFPVEPNRNKSFIFWDADLLIARQIAFQNAIQVVTEKSIHNAIDIDIDLIETNRYSVPSQQQVITRVFKQRFNRTSFMDEETDMLIDMDRNSLVARSLPASIFLTIGLERDHEAGNSLEVVEKALTTEELAYYQQHGYSTSLPQHQE